MRKLLNLLIQNISYHQIITKNSFWLGFSKVISGILRALLVIYSARILGPERYGNFSLAINFVLIFSFLPEFGLTSILTRELSKEKNENRYKVFNCIFSISLILSILSYFLIFLIGFFVIKSNVAFKLLPILGLMMVFDVLREMIYSIYRAQLKGEIQGILHFLTNLLLFLIGIILLIIFKNEIYLALGYLLAIFLGFLLSIFFALDFIKRFKFIIDWALYKLYFNSSWPIALGNTLYLLLLYTDSIILNLYHSSFLVGVYNSAVKINEFLVLLPSGVALAILPMLSRNLNNKQTLNAQVNYSIYLNYLLTLPIMLGIFILSDKIVNFIFGKEYEIAYVALRILIPSLLASSLFMLFSQLLIVLDKRKELLLYEFIAFMVNLILNLILIPKYGLLAASFNTTFANYIVLFFANLNIKKYYPDIKIFYKIKKPLLASLGMAIFVYLIKNLFMLWIVLLGAIFYILTLFLLKDELTLKILNKIFQKD